MSEAAHVGCRRVVFEHPGFSGVDPLINVRTIEGRLAEVDLAAYGRETHRGCIGLEAHPQTVGLIQPVIRWQRRCDRRVLAVVVLKDLLGGPAVFRLSFRPIL